MPQVELSAGTTDYDDAGGAGPVVALVHGLLLACVTLLLPTGLWRIQHPNKSIPRDRDTVTQLFDYGSIRYLRIARTFLEGPYAGLAFI